MDKESLKKKMQGLRDHAKEKLDKSGLADKLQQGKDKAMDELEKRGVMDKLQQGKDKAMDELEKRGLLAKIKEKKKFVIGGGVAALLLLANTCMGPSTGSMKDAEGNKYRTVKIGDQVWMAENLNVGPEGYLCTKAKNKREETKTCKEGWYVPGDVECHKGINDNRACRWGGSVVEVNKEYVVYGGGGTVNSSYDLDDDGICGKNTGKRYDWYTAMESCPEGWHLPSLSEFKKLMETLGVKSNETSEYHREKAAILYAKRIETYTKSRHIQYVKNGRLDENFYDGAGKSGFDAIGCGDYRGLYIRGLSSTHFGPDDGLEHSGIDHGMTLSYWTSDSSNGQAKTFVLDYGPGGSIIWTSGSESLAGNTFYAKDGTFYHYVRCVKD